MRGPDPIRAVFYGTPAEAVPALESLRTVAEVALVVTQPDRPKGRSGRPQAPPVKEAAEAFGLPVAQPTRASSDLDPIREVAPDIAVVVAYGQLLKPELLAIPRRGFLNIHFSLLPRWRGASPVVRSILAGDQETGVTLMQLDEGMDTGPVWARARTAIGPEESAGDLAGRLAEIGAELLAERLPAIVAGETEPVPQDDALATAAAKVRVEEAHVDPIRHGSDAVLRAVRAFDPRPGAWTVLEGQRFKLWQAASAAAGSDTEPGVASFETDRVILGTRDGAVELRVVQPAGKARMPAADWMRGRRNVPARFG
jgi:methionyl-tRNA formyltransferase